MTGNSSYLYAEPNHWVILIQFRVMVEDFLDPRGVNTLSKWINNAFADRKITTDEKIHLFNLNKVGNYGAHKSIICRDYKL